MLAGGAGRVRDARRERLAPPLSRAPRAPVGSGADRPCAWPGNPVGHAPVLRAGEAAGTALVDLTDRVTVFVSTVGAPTFADCLAHLAAQDCRFTQRVIERVAPMHVAFQRMIDECRTPFYVQVDEDMLLEPHAVRTLHARMAASPPRTAIVMADLYDAHLRRCLHGVRIYRHAVVRRYPFSGADSFEKEQAARLEADGYVVDSTPSDHPSPPEAALGRHGTRWTPPLIYERYATLERRRLAEPPNLRWFAPYGAEFLARFQADPTEENFFALMGVVAGVLGSRQGPAAAKDFRTYDRLPGFAALRAFLDAFAAPPSEQ